MDTMMWVAVSLSGAVGIGGVVVAGVALARQSQHVEALRVLACKAMDQAFAAKNPELRVAELQAEASKWHALYEQSRAKAPRGVEQDDMVSDNVDLAESAIGDSADDY